MRATHVKQRGYWRPPHSTTTSIYLSRHARAQVFSLPSKPSTGPRIGGRSFACFPSCLLGSPTTAARAFELQINKTCDPYSPSLSRRGKGTRERKEKGGGRGGEGRQNTQSGLGRQSSTPPLPLLLVPSLYAHAQSIPQWTPSENEGRTRNHRRRHSETETRYQISRTRQTNGQVASLPQ